MGQLQHCGSTPARADTPSHHHLDVKGRFQSSRRRRVLDGIPVSESVAGAKGDAPAVRTDTGQIIGQQMQPG
jgi:hypothetical protein